MPLKVDATWNRLEERAEKLFKKKKKTFLQICALQFEGKTEKEERNTFFLSL